MKTETFGYMVGNGNKSVDRKIKKLIAYVEDKVNTYPELWEQQGIDRIAWAIKTIEDGVKNIINGSFAYRH